MATDIIYLTGICKWAKFKKPDEKYNNFTVDFYPRKDAQDKINNSGLQVTPKEDENGSYYKFRRPMTKLINNEVVTFGPPQILNKDNEPFDGFVGNGSEVTLKLAVFDTKKGRGHRWEVLRVENLVEFIPTDDNGDQITTNKGFIPPFSEDQVGGKKAVSNNRKAPF